MITIERIAEIKTAIEAGDTVAALGDWDFLTSSEVIDLCNLAHEALNNRQWTPDKAGPRVVDIGPVFGKCKHCGTNVRLVELMGITPKHGDECECIECFNKLAKESK